MSPREQVLLSGGTLIDGTGAAPRSGTDVLLEADSVVAVGAEASATAEPGAERIDVSGHTVMPGLIDVALPHHLR